MRKKTVVMLLAIALVAILQTACSSVGQVVDGTSEQTPAPGSPGEPSTPSGSGNGSGVVDFGG